MTRVRLLLAALSTFLMLACDVETRLWAQGSKADYERAARLAEETRDKVHPLQVEPHWSQGGNAFWYQADDGDGRHRYFWLHAQRGEVSPLVDAERLAVAIQQATGKPMEPERLPLHALEVVWEKDLPRRLRFILDEHRWDLDLETYRLDRRDDQATLETTVPRLDRVRRSRGGGRDTSLRFINRASDVVQLFWVDRGAQPVRYGELAPGTSREQHTFGGHVWLVKDGQDRIRGIFQATEASGTAVIDDTVVAVPVPENEGAAGQGPEGNAAPVASPDGRWEAFIRDDNLWIRDRGTRAEVALSLDGTPGARYAPPFLWSPDSTRLACVVETPGDGRRVHLVESTPRDQLQPRLLTLDYDKPGDRLPVAKPRLFDVARSRAIPMSDELFANPWSITDYRWSSDSRELTFLYNERGHQRMRLLAVDSQTGSVRPLVDEASPTFIDYAHKVFFEFIPRANELVWMSERDGWNHLYLVDAATGEVKNPITRGNWVVRRVQRVDVEHRQVWLFASGIEEGQDPYFEYLCRVNFDGSGWTVLTPGPGTHRVEFSPDGRFLLDTWSRVDQPPVTELRESDTGRLVCEVARADASELLATGWRPPVPFAAPGRDGHTMIHGVLYFPRDLRADRKYPVIEQIYAGPQDSYVPKSFRSYYDEQALAELGFIVVQIDGMGTSNRSKAFHDVCWKNLGDAGFPDRKSWLRAAAERYPSMDLTRVGIYGGSAGGQNALRGLLMHPETYHVGVADCGCHDNRMDKVWWNELWMGWPVGPHYAEQSNVTQAHRLQGKLLLTVGELDRNVDPASTMQVVDALIRADRDFELLVIPGSDHGAGESAYARRRRADFFVRHLLGREPRWEP